ncbi:DUF305 domain-containing protein [Aureimonas ureilytica]|jgi:uncharacterized protein (DUF305 family)|uniref:DUF305 domain-containing protein n=1 Tax=Aureimonas flava TaxID=2320271 RepID=A0A3A1WIA7_9HYPH|nr:DUF305 domain-containing protein [Aureimonas flava]RIX99132.1 DUF305 domain-containing protein [Aureimonas flava]
MKAFAERLPFQPVLEGNASPMLKTLLLALAFAGMSLTSAEAQDARAHQHATMAPASPDGSPYAQATAAAMETMHAGMMSAPVTGDPDHDFLSQMIPHHQGAIDMAKAVLGSTEDPAIRNLAQSIITEQTYEITLMRSMLAASADTAKPVPETTP